MLDALGLDEHRDAGRFLTAFDALLVEAGIRDAFVVTHMGHTNERARGDSRLRVSADEFLQRLERTPVGKTVIKQIEDERRASRDALRADKRRLLADQEHTLPALTTAYDAERRAMIEASTTLQQRTATCRAAMGHLLTSSHQFDQSLARLDRQLEQSADPAIDDLLGELDAHERRYADSELIRTYRTTTC